MLKGFRSGREPGGRRSSLRTELLFNLAFLATAALFLALWTASVLQLSVLSFPRSVALLVLLVVLDVLVFVALGRYLVDRLVVRPVAEAATVAEAIATGDFARRVPSGGTVEMASLANAVNHLTDQLLQNQERLAENVRSLDETNRILNETQRELVQAEKMASIGRLAAGIAHEIGNPLGALIGYVAVLRKRDGEPELLDGIGREASRIDQIVRGLLDYARPGSAPRESVSVNASIERVLDLLRKQGRLSGLDVQLDLQADVPPIDAVPTRIDQIFVNLFQNAEAAMSGKGQLKVVTRHARYQPEQSESSRRADDPPGVDYSHLRRLRHGSFRDTNRLQTDREIVRVVVADTGPGIPIEQIDSIFDPFFTTKPPGKGTGLGLAIVASTVAELGGRIDVTSAESGGATFALSLPTAEAAS